MASLPVDSCHSRLHHETRTASMHLTSKPQPYVSTWRRMHMADEAATQRCHAHRRDRLIPCGLVLADTDQRLVRRQTLHSVDSISYRFQRIRKRRCASHGGSCRGSFWPHTICEPTLDYRSLLEKYCCHTLFPACCLLKSCMLFTHFPQRRSAC
jgi:hypothetical protein